VRAGSVCYHAGMAGSTRWLYELGAATYGWCTAQAGWAASCAALVAGLPPAPRRILDLGCGPGGVLAAAAAARPSAHLYGVDVAARMLSEALRRRPWATARPARSPRLVRADALRLPFPDGAFDAVTGHSFLYLVPQRAAVLAEAWRVLAPGGRLALMEPWAGPPAPRAVLRHSRDPRFLISVTLWRLFSRWRGRFGARELAALLVAQGFVAARGQVALGGLGLVAYADKPLPASEPREST